MSAIEPGDLLYKYRSFNNENFKHIEDLFLNNRIYFPSPKEFNDPFDCQVDLSFEGTDYQWRKYLLRGLKRTRPDLSSSERILEAQRIINSGAHKKLDPSIGRRTTDQVGIYCLSAVNDDILMWSHYADKHTGIVVEFQANPLDFFFRRAQAVEYQQQYPKVSIFDSDEWRMKAAVLTKSEHWAYEREYRIIEFQSGPGAYVFPAHLLTGVIFGCEMTNERKAQIREWISRRSPKPTIYQARKKEREFSLAVEIAP